MTSNAIAAHDEGHERHRDGPAAYAEFTTVHSAVLVCAGELDSSTNPDLRRSLEQITSGAANRVVVDIAAVSFLGCGTITEFLTARDSCRTAGGDLTLRSPSAMARRLFRMLDLDDLVADDPAVVVDQPGTGDATADLVASWRAVGRRTRDLVASWRAVCQSEGFGSSTIVFADPNLMVSTVARLFDSPPTPVSDIAADLVASATRTDDWGSSVAVMQLLALSSVAHTWITSNVRGDVHQDRRARLGGDIDVAVAAVMSAGLDALEATALLDPLTGLLNRRALDRDLVPLLAAARRHGQCLSVVMIDVEGLKATNDRYGHAAGDDTLRDVASSLAGALRAGDNAYRIGGDEFVLLFPDLCPDDVDTVMGRTVVGAHRAFTWGCAWVSGEDDPIPDSDRAAHLLRLADERMLAYRARARGTEHDAPVTPPREAVSAPSVELAGQLEAGNRASIVIEQARGVIAEHFSVSVEDATQMLRAFARRQRQSIVEAAAAVVDRTVDVADLSEHQPGLDAEHLDSSVCGPVAGSTGGTA